MLTYSSKEQKFYINGKEVSGNSGRCCDCTQPTVVVKANGRAWRVGCACSDGTPWHEVKRI